MLRRRIDAIEIDRAPFERIDAYVRAACGRLAPGGDEPVPFGEESCGKGVVGDFDRCGSNARTGQCVARRERRGHKRTRRNNAAYSETKILFFCNGKADDCYSDHERGGLVRLGVRRASSGWSMTRTSGGAAFSLPAFWG